MPSEESLAAVDTALSEMSANMVFFEDTRSLVLSKLLRRLNYSGDSPYEFPQKTKVEWHDPKKTDIGQLIEDYKVYGPAGDVPKTLDSRCRLMEVSRRRRTVGAVAFADYGRFARCKYSERQPEGFCIATGDDGPETLLLVLCREMLKEQKRYLILGGPIARYAGPIHPFSLWHMQLLSPSAQDHSCRLASYGDMSALAELTSEYEDTDTQAAFKTVVKYFSAGNFKYVISGDREGFALVKYLDGAEGMLHDLFVSPQHQGRGIGDDLTRAAIDKLSSHCIRIHLNTVYPRAKRLYEKHGFETEYVDQCVALRQKMMTR